MTTRIPQYKVSIWETIAIFLGAIALVAAGLTGLGMKLLKNASKPQQAEAIASKIMQFDIPDAQGLIGLNIAGAKVAVVTSKGEEPDIMLLVARVPVDEESGKRRIERILDNIALEDEQSFKVSGERVETKKLCGESVLVNVKTGKMKLLDSPKFKATVAYRTSVTLSGSRYVVNLLANGPQAKQKATTVFNSLQCQK
jgi:hypothetical protein